MPFVSRDAAGNIVAVSETATAACSEQVSSDNAGLLRYLDASADASPEAIRQRLAESDLKMVRLVDDLIGVLIEKRVIQFTDLPPAAREKYMQRQDARRQLHDSSNLIIGEKDIL